MPGSDAGERGDAAAGAVRGMGRRSLVAAAEASELRPAALLRDTHTPRLVALELKGAAGSLRDGGAEPEAPVAWDGDVAAYLERGGSAGSRTEEEEKRRGAAARGEEAAAEGAGGGSASAEGAAPALAQAAAPQEGSRVQVWSDQLHVQLHPKSLYVISQYMHDGACGCLEAFGQGESLLQHPGCVEELEDRLHFYVEECDYLQGFQVLCDLHSGFSGVGAKVTELLYDEYSGKGILTWGLTPALRDLADYQKSFYRLMNTALGIVHLSRHSSLFCPLSLSGSLGLRPQPPVAFPYISYDASLHYHSSAILAAVLDTLTAPYRLWSSQASMMHLAETLNFSGRKVVAAWASVPFPALQGSSLPDALCAYQQDVPWKLLSSCRDRKSSCCFAQSVVLRGFGKESHGSSCAGNQPLSPLHTCEGTEQVLQHYLHTAFPGAFSTSQVLEQPCPTQPPYPQIFSPLLSREGFLLDKPPPSSSAAVGSIPVLAALQSSPVLHTLLSSLYKDLQKVNTRRCLSFFSAGVEEDDFHEALQELRTLSECYETGLEAGDSEDEGDSD
ncbi:protein misato homolog 1 isoform X3 [Colius striatus]|uniref:protein misato homolog 1 isoform X3 n=1 Tax=Colius striatus TaxID=57412 RepID=UPI002B1DEC38|nr:protein misato homolog 1 isoform X3 [Colius striatus]